MIGTRPSEKPRKASSGFTLLEMMCATVILLIALFAVAQLVPVSINLNSQNRRDSAALVFAQRELDQMMEQPLSAPVFTDAQGNICNLGDAGNPNTLVGNAVASNGDGVSIINFDSTQIPGYSFTYLDPTSPGATLDVRWAVVTTTSNTGVVTSKRFIIGVRQQGGNGFFLPITLDSMVER